MKKIICPTVLAGDPHAFREQMERVAPLANRIQIDLMDGEFAPTKSIELKRIWWPHDIMADIHLMYQRPMEYLDKLIELKPHMVIVHNEADVHHMHFAAELHKHKIKTGLALLKETPVHYAHQIMHSFDHVLIFSGDLGRFGGEADLNMLDKVFQVKEHYPEIEVGWDGGINDRNAHEIAEGGVDVLNVGGYIQNSENPREAYAKLKEVIKQRKHAPET